MFSQAVIKLSCYLETHMWGGFGCVIFTHTCLYKCVNMDERAAIVDEKEDEGLAATSDYPLPSLPTFLSLSLSNGF